MHRLISLAFMMCAITAHGKSLEVVKDYLTTALAQESIAHMGYHLNSSLINTLKLNEDIAAMGSKQMFNALDKAMEELGWGKYYIDVMQLSHAQQRRYGVAPYNGTDKRKMREQGYRRTLFVREDNLSNLPEELQSATYSAYVTGGFSAGDPAVTRILGLHDRATRTNTLEEDIVQDFVDKLKTMRLTTPTGEPVLSLLMEVRAENLHESSLCPRGHADCVLYYPTAKFHALFIEFKTPYNGLSPRQVEFRERVHRLGYKYFVARSAGEAISAINKYMANNISVQTKHK